MAGRYVILLLFACVNLLTVASAQNAAHFFDEGNEHFRQGAFGEAIESYHLALAEGSESGELYFNLANAYYRQDEIGEAILYYEKARKKLGDTQEITHNLGIARTQIRDRFSETPEPFWVAGMDRLVRSISPWMIFIVGALLYIFAIGFKVVTISRRTSTDWSRRTFWWTLTLASVLIVVALVESYYIHNNIQGVVVVAETEFSLVDEDGSDQISQIHEGVLLDLLERTDNRWMVKLPNGTRGWVDADAVQEI